MRQLPRSGSIESSSTRTIVRRRGGIAIGSGLRTSAGGLRQKLERGLHARVRLRDVARLAGVSEPTASRSLRNDPQISATTRAIVQRVADQAGYVPNAAARSLALRQSQTLGLMVPDVTDPVHGQIVSGFEDEATKQGRVLLVSNFRYDPQSEERGLKALMSHQAEGVAIFGGVVDPKLLRRRWPGANLVFIGPENLSSLAKDPPRGTIVADDAAGAGAAVEAAWAQGYRRFGYLSGPPLASNERRRMAAAAALKARGGPPMTFHQCSDGGYEDLARRIKRAGNDLVLCFDDQRALKLLSALTQIGVRVPAHIGIIGFDDIPFAALSNPPLSTVAVRHGEVGRFACRMLLQQAASGALAAPVRFGVRLVMRGTTSDRRRA